MSKQDYCIHWVDLSHLSTSERRAAAVWACDQFGADSADIMSPKEKMGRYGSKIIPGFWFAREKDAVFFSLRWSR